MNDLLKVIINFIKKHPMRYLVSFILMIGSSIAAVYPARIIGQVVDKIVASELNAEVAWDTTRDFSRDYSCGVYYGEYLDIFYFYWVL